MMSNKVHLVRQIRVQLLQIISNNFDNITHTTSAAVSGILYRTTCVSRYQKGKSGLALNEARDDRVFAMAVASAGPYANNLHLALDR